MAIKAETHNVYAKQVVTTDLCGDLRKKSVTICCICEQWIPGPLSAWVVPGYEASNVLGSTLPKIPSPDFKMVYPWVMMIYSLKLHIDTYVYFASEAHYTFGVYWSVYAEE